MSCAFRIEFWIPLNAKKMPLRGLNWPLFKYIGDVSLGEPLYYSIMKQKWLWRNEAVDSWYWAGVGTGQMEGEERTEIYRFTRDEPLCSCCRCEETYSWYVQTFSLTLLGMLLKGCTTLEGERMMVEAEMAQWGRGSPTCFHVFLPHVRWSCRIHSEVKEDNLSWERGRSGAGVTPWSLSWDSSGVDRPRGAKPVLLRRRPWKWMQSAEYQRERIMVGLGHQLCYQQQSTQKGEQDRGRE